MYVQKIMDKLRLPTQVQFSMLTLFFLSPSPLWHFFRELSIYVYIFNYYYFSPWQGTMISD